ncbi:hypothetical protein AB0M94_39010 [Streptomyces xanthochromogenes]|uniref:hypothetical protein n=1 Tax=Streptomyces xanthochromogenes TaxID=67384 RepID=UPI00341498B4
MLLTDDPCSNIIGLAGEYCRSGQKGAKPDTAKLDPNDPLTSLALSIAKGADWTAGQLGKLVSGDKGAIVDFSGANFVRQYAIVFAASTFLVLVLWLLAVGKRALRGAPLTTAISEAIGFLWLAVLATAFTPLVLYTLVSAVDAVTDTLTTAFGSSPGGLFTSMGSDLKNGKLGGGPLMLAAVSFATIVLCGLLYLFLYMRALALYVGALLGVVVYAGVVDKNLWGHIRRWAGFMVMLILVKPIIVIVLGLAAVMESNGHVVTGLGVTVVAIGVGIYTVWKLPGMGDAVRVARTAARTAAGTARTIAGPRTATAGVQSGIQTHATRGGDSGRTNSGSQRPSNPLSGGISAHSQRTPKPKKKDG